MKGTTNGLAIPPAERGDRTVLSRPFSGVLGVLSGGTVDSGEASTVLHVVGGINYSFLINEQ